MKKWITFLLLTFLVYVEMNAQQDSFVADTKTISFLKIPAGKFQYGKFEPPFPVPDSSNGEYRGLRVEDFKLAAEYAKRDRLPGFEVVIPRDFYLSRYEITQAQWKSVMGNNPSVFAGDDLPVENISWNDAIKFVDKLNRSDSTYHYRLPTEFEWEYAARAGARDDISWKDIREQAQLGTRTTNKVGQKKPNNWGLYDMLGNVWEWTSDFYNGKIFADSFPAVGGDQHVLKGASFTGDVKNATYLTHAAGPGNKWDVGLRIVREEKKLRNYPAVKKSKRLSADNSRRTSKSNAIPGWHLSRTTHQGTTPLVRMNKGVITLMQQPYGQGGVLLTNKMYRNFELSVEVKIDSFCNGGIFLRSTESGQAYQVELSEPGGTGSLFGEMLRISKPAVAETKSKVWKAGTWNHFRIRMVGEIPRVTLWINGELMWDVTQPENDFIAAAKEGMIGLQVHWSATYSKSADAFDMSSSWRPGGRHMFRNFKITELPDSLPRR